MKNYGDFVAANENRRGARACTKRQEMKLDFSVRRVKRPLASVPAIVADGNCLVLGPWRHASSM